MDKKSAKQYVPNVVATAPARRPPLATASAASAVLNFDLSAVERANRVDDARAKNIVDNYLRRYLDLVMDRRFYADILWSVSVFSFFIR